MRIFDTPPELKDLKSEMPNLKALLWDMDGTILNTEKIHAEATFEVIKQNPGLKQMKEEHVFNFVLGQTDSEVYYRLNKENLIANLDLLTFIDIKDDIFLNMVRQAPTDSCINPQISRLLTDASKANIKNVLVTSSENKIAIELLSHFKIIEMFEHIITRESTARNKPDPSPFNLATKLSGVKKSEALIFEDSPIGLEAARQSGIQFIQANWY